MKILNKAQVNVLFQREAVLFGVMDGVPAFRAAALFGAEAVDHARAQGTGAEYSNGYGVGDYTLMYLTLRGFQAAASYYNVQQLREEAGA